ncbi:MAG TPA: 2Fe-2S iron-sulfur cluster-binding protein [Candidatus Acidoferrales bacterium]|nr:2Fe-2S iron-sulfur cluster-binding protein [Candidatus Acidoferrales bacterium]
MPKLRINGIEVEVEIGTSVLEAARFLGLPIPTLCHNDGLTPYGACRLCVVEVGNSNGNGRPKLLSACTLQVEDGMVVHTHSSRVERARKLLLEMYVATCPQSKTIQDLASRYGVTQMRLEPKHETCIQCGLCVRMCAQQMMAGAIGFAKRGARRKVSRPFDMTSELCRQCGACLYVCPVCELRCQGPQAETTLCSGCLNFAPVCFQSYDDAMCFLDPCHACELTGPLRPDVPVKLDSEKSAK